MSSNNRFEYMRSTGAGGQNVNKLDTACRVTHLPTKLTAHCEEERSQLRNRDKAVKKLKAELFRIRYEEETTRANRERKSQVQYEDLSPYDTPCAWSTIKVHPTFFR